MFFIVSKIAWFFLEPVNFLLALLSLGTLLLGTRWRRLAAALIGLSATLLLVCGPGPLGTLLALPLENRFQRPVPPPHEIAGIIVLGGAIHPDISSARHQIVLSQAGSRLTEAVAASRLFPDAPLIFSGGSGRLIGARRPEAERARDLLIRLGVAPQRLKIEDRSRNTWQNAIYTRDLIHPAVGQKWLLVTSAVHMPRAMGVFRKAGFDVVPWPSGYLTKGSLSSAFADMGSAIKGLERTDAAVHEWIGLIAYRWAGRTNQFFPAPATPRQAP